MVRTVEIIALYPGNPDTVFESALRFSELTEAMAGFAKYSGFPADDTASEGDTFAVDVTFWGWFRQSGHTIFIERLDRQARTIQSREKSPGVRRWDHLLSVQSKGNMVCWTDRVEIDAGWRTWFVARFAAYMYTLRHRCRNAASITSRILTAAEGSNV